ncbi:VOC family protein [bacterium]|nr:VOC family protein [bacterium]
MYPVVHFEMPYKDAQRAKRFYEKSFGWKMELLGPEMDNYLLATTAQTDAKKGAPAGAINGGLFPFKPDWPNQFPSVVIGVDDIDAVMKRIDENGGEVLGEPHFIPGTGKYVSFLDTEGNRNSVIEPVMPS